MEALGGSRATNIRSSRRSTLQRPGYPKVVETGALSSGDKDLGRAGGKRIADTKEKKGSKYYHNPIIALLRLDANDFHDDRTSSGSGSDSEEDTGESFRGSDYERGSPRASRSHSRHTSPGSQSIGIDHGHLTRPLVTSGGEGSETEEEDTLSTGHKEQTLRFDVQSALRDDGSETESDRDDEKVPPDKSTMGTKDHLSTKRVFNAPVVVGQKPFLVPRADQVEKRGHFRLTRPKVPSFPNATEESAPAFDPKAGSSQTKYQTHSVPAPLNKFLRDYQRDGVQFFYERYCENRGGILGDDMGLGKTIQVIAFLAAIMEKHNDAQDIARRMNYVSRQQDRIMNGELDHLPPANAIWPTALIIVPVSVISNWQRELDTWGYFEVGTYAGTKETRETTLKDFKLGRLDVVLSSFEQVRDHISEFEDLPWSCIFLDEAHKIKNINASITKAYNRFLCPVRFGLTGTAVQNTYNELWPLLAWSNPERLGNERHWKWAISRPLALGQSQSATEAERRRAIILTKALKENLLPLFFLRRTKKLIEDQLPKKFDDVVFCPLTPMQLRVYKRFLDTEDVKLMLHKDEPCDCGSNGPRGKCCYTSNSKGVQWHELMLKYIGIFIKISNHLMLLYPSEGENPEQRKRSREYLEVAFPEDSEMRKSSSRLRPGMCGKWTVLEKLLDQWRAKPEEQNKVLIFSKSVKLLEFLELELSKKYGRDKLCYLDGKTKSEDRMPIVDKFNCDPVVYCFLISTTAGGTGLNLTAANKVVVFDPHWNPAHDLQAMDRAYRYGQLRNVSVYRLLGAGSLEELVYARQIYKQQQMHTAYEGIAQTRYFEGVQDDKKRQGELFGLKNLFMLHPSAHATKYHIERALVNELEWALMNAPTKSKGDDDYDIGRIGALILDEGELGTLRPKPSLNDPIDNADDVEGLLKSIGMYRHRNEEIIKPTRVANRRAIADLKGDKRRGRKSDADSPASDTTWPPKRKKHANSKILPKRKMSENEAQLAKRKRTLLAKSYIVDYDEDYRRFALKFKNMDSLEQHKLIRELDRLESDGEDLDSSEG